ncbi:MAG: hypothetical protein COV44_08600 [Deltaproteobacteria bacterium CG11_big_fil_rev_8_21_14_0_20_45_16]|nr:MAG: hypothetical protein COV44_08600 [Deltaproteobacteria bacterium CG11_big_fil_rev_8_21_14_0_20_45_16]
MFKVPISWIVLAVALTACGSSKNLPKLRPGPGGSTGNLARDAAEAAKDPARLRERSETMGRRGGLYFARIQIVDESSATDNCEASFQRVESSSHEAIVELNSQNILNWKADTRARQSVLEIQWRSLGFDHGRYEFSLVDGKPNLELPFVISSNVRPNNEVELRVFDSEIIRLRLDQTPIYSFAVEEKRANCSIHHNINIFSDAAGRYLSAN